MELSLAGLLPLLIEDSKFHEVCERLERAVKINQQSSGVRESQRVCYKYRLDRRPYDHGI